MPLDSFHPAVSRWFSGAFSAPTPAQAQAWPAIASGRHTLIAAPTGSGKTLAAFLAAIDELIRRGIEQPLPDETAVVYVSPLKALSNDVRLNLELPLAGIRAELARLNLPDVAITTCVRTGDTPQAERDRMRRRPPHIVVTTPESLYILLGSESGRRMLATTRSVIVDEIHALAPNKRGAHLSLTLERLDALCGRRLVRIGLSATQKPIGEVARFLTGGVACPIPAFGHLPPQAGEGQAQVLSSAEPDHMGSDARPAFLPDASSPPAGSDHAASVRQAPSFPCTAGEGADRRNGALSGARTDVAETEPACTIVDAGHARARDLALELPEGPLEAVMSGDGWTQVYARLEALIAAHRTTLIFVNTRRMAERAARHLSERLGKDKVTAHHGSLSKEHRFDAEQRLKRGELSALVATASLELGIDIGDVDLVCQIGSPRSIAAFLQRVGRAGHQVDGTPKGRLFPQSRDDLVECAALLDAVRRGELDALRIENAPLDVLAQQIVAEVAARDCSEDELFDLVRRAYPFAALSRDDFMAVVRMLSDGFSSRRGPRAGYLHRDAVNGIVRASRGARLTAITSGGAIPDTADYEVTLEPQASRVGSVNEDFAVESLAGDVFQLGNQSYRILRVERGRVRVEDAQGAPPTIPFWLGEAPGRSDELSHAVSRLRETLSALLDGRPATRDHGDDLATLPASSGAAGAHAWLVDELGLGEAAARQIVDYLGAAKIALGVLPSQRELVMERFFDESGGTQLVIHSPYGSRINRAWGLALRKRFCRTFNFELQAAATEDAIVLSLSTSHSFPLADVARYLHSGSVRDVLVQALLDAPMFGVRWRWNAVAALALPRFTGGSRVAPQLQRMKSEDLLATVFPDQVACAENLVGEREVPEHPLVAQTLHDCLEVAMDIEGLIGVLRGLELGDVRMVARDLTSPSPLAAEVLGARPYAYLDDAPLEERRTQAVSSRRWSDAASADDLGRLDDDAIAAVREEAWPDARSADELHAALMGVAYITDGEASSNAGWPERLASLASDRRVARLCLPQPAPNGVTDLAAGFARGIWVTAERLPQFDAVLPDAVREPAIVAPHEYAAVAWSRETALVDVLRGRLTALGPARVGDLAVSLGIAIVAVERGLIALETEGFVMRGPFSAHSATDAASAEWCERHLLARIHRYTVNRLRREIEPVEPRDFMRFLFEWQRVAPGSQVSGPDALAGVLAQLEGYEAPASAWEGEILPARVAGYEIAWLDALCVAGRVVWTRLRARKPAATARAGGPVRATPIVLVQRRNLEAWLTLGALGAHAAAALSSRAQAVADHLAARGASFFDELLDATRLLHVELEEALAELVAAGLINADSFSGLRALLVPSAKRPSTRRRHGRRTALFGIEDAGRWSLVRKGAVAEVGATPVKTDAGFAEHVARVLLRRYGVVCWRMLAHEADWLPPWRDLLRVYQRLEARGDIRGGRFVAGISGEQFALPDAIVALRRVRHRPLDGSLTSLSGADPLNLVGSLLAGNRVPRVVGARVLYRDGVPLATRVAGDVTILEPLDPPFEQRVRQALLRGTRAPVATDARSEAGEEE